MDDVQPVSVISCKFKMELNEVKSIKLDLGDGKYVKLHQTFSVKETISAQGGILSCPKNEQFIFIPSGALLSDTIIEATVYHVVDSVGLDSTEFVTSMLEITPHDLKFQKPIEILMSHHLFVDGDGSKVTVLFHSGASTVNSFTSLCELTSVNESHVANGMTMTLWEDFIHIETSHICMLKAICKGKSFIKVWALLFTHKTPDQFCVRLFLTKSRPKPTDEIFEDMKMTGCEFECRHCTQLTLTCGKKENLQVTVKMPSSANGWAAETNSDLSRTILYKDIQNLVVQDRPYISTDFVFQKTSDVGVTDFAPVFLLNHNRCFLSSSSTSRQTADAVSTGSQQNNVSGNFFTLFVCCYLFAKNGFQLMRRRGMCWTAPDVSVCQPVTAPS